MSCSAWVRHPKANGATFSKSEIIRGLRHLAPRLGLKCRDRAGRPAAHEAGAHRQRGGAGHRADQALIPARANVLSAPTTCACPKATSPASRARSGRRSTISTSTARPSAGCWTYHHNGHPVDKVELIVLGGTWSFYPEDYQIWFVRRLFDALNDFCLEMAAASAPTAARSTCAGRFRSPRWARRSTAGGSSRTYNQVVTDYLRRNQGGELHDRRESAGWDSLEAAQQRNEGAAARCVGLVIETRPGPPPRTRRCGGSAGSAAPRCRSASRACRRGARAQPPRPRGGRHPRAPCASCAAPASSCTPTGCPTCSAPPRARRGGFPAPFRRARLPPRRAQDLSLQPDRKRRADAALHGGEWRPYGDEELAGLLEACLLEVPEYCRVTRTIRDIPGDDILVGNKVTNLREVVERRLAARGLRSRDIRAREVRAAGGGRRPGARPARLRHRGRPRGFPAIRRRGKAARRFLPACAAGGAGPDRRDRRQRDDPRGARLWHARRPPAGRRRRPSRVAAGIVEVGHRPGGDSAVSAALPSTASLPASDAPAARRYTPSSLVAPCPAGHAHFGHRPRSPR